MDNPFDVTKAVDFSDDEIAQTYVEFPDGSFQAIVSPKQSLPIFLVGGKGGGRTHLLRRFSYSVQSEEGKGSLEDSVESGYLGVYFRCSGLNGARFSGKRQTDDVWAAVFAAYMDLWLTQLLVHCIIEIAKASKSDVHPQPWTATQKAAFVDSMRSVADMGEIVPDVTDSPDPLSALADGLGEELKRLDRRINNAAITGRLEITVRASPGQIVFSSVELARKTLPGLEKIKIAFLVDEFENLAPPQQKYLNTLIREKTRGCTFVVGSRRWGIRTMDTLTADEPNRVGSEFEQIVLEDRYKAKKKLYFEFCANLVSARLRAASLGEYSSSELNFVLGEAKAGDPLFDDRLWADNLTDLSNPQHVKRMKADLSKAVSSPDSADAILSGLRLSNHPIVEKWIFLQFYRMWASRGLPTADEARQIRQLGLGIMDGTAPKTTRTAWKHWKQDLLAQYYVEAGLPVPHLGFRHFVDMSGYLPRNLLVLLKNITRWSQLADEAPFVSDRPIGRKAVHRGVFEAANWFRTDSMPLGADGLNCDRAISRLGQFLREHRFAPKPVEVGCSTFSTDLRAVTPDAIRVLSECQKRSLLLEGSRADRNTGARIPAFQINPMLTPLFDLSPARRGVLSMKPEELTAIFDPDASDSDFDAVLSARMKTLHPPFRWGTYTEAMF